MGWGRGGVVGGGGRAARLWDAFTGEHLLDLGHLGLVTFAAFSPDGKRLVTASSDDTARLWVVTPSTRTSSIVLRGHRDMVNHAAFSPDGKRLVTGS